MCSIGERRTIPWLSNRPSKCHARRKPTTEKTRNGKKKDGIAVTQQKVPFFSFGDSSVAFDKNALYGHKPKGHNYKVGK